MYIVCCLVTKSCATLLQPHECSPPGSSVWGISQARTLEWVAISLSRVSSRPRDQTQVSCLAGRFCTIEPPGKPIYMYIYIVCVCVHTYMYTHICVHTYVYVYPHVYMCIHICIQIHMYTHICLCMRERHLIWLLLS